jgi:hypothetical protein
MGKYLVISAKTRVWVSGGVCRWSTTGRRPSGLTLREGSQYLPAAPTRRANGPASGPPLIHAPQQQTIGDLKQVKFLMGVALWTDDLMTWIAKPSPPQFRVVKPQEDRSCGYGANIAELSEPDIQSNCTQLNSMNPQLAKFCTTRSAESEDGQSRSIRWQQMSRPLLHRAARNILCRFR